MTLLYNGIQYEIENEGEIEKINIGGVDEQESDAKAPPDEYKESAWDPNNVQLFLDECVKRKTELRNPSVRRRKIFADIRGLMKRKGYDFRIESLDRKLRNLKIHYLVTRQNKKSLRRTHWPYYDKMKAIYPVEFCSGRKRLASTGPPLESHSPPDYRSTSSSPLLSQTEYKKPLEGPIPSRSLFLDDEDTPTNISYFDHSNKIGSLRMQILSFEERRTVAAEKILNELHESNRLKKELLELNIKMFKAKRELGEE